MKRVVKRALPGGVVPFSNVRDLEVRSVLMRLNENIASLKKQLEAAQEAIRELQRR